MNKGWHPDPAGRFEQRLWNGTRWTSQVYSGGHVTSDPYDEPAPAELAVAEPAAPPAEDVAAAAGPLLALPSLRVVQTNAGVSPDYDLYGPAGEAAGTIRDVGSSMLAELASFVLDGVETTAKHLLEVRDTTGALVLRMRHGGMLKSRLVVEWPSGAEAGRIEGDLLARSFALRAGGADVGCAKATKLLGSRLEVLDHLGVAVGEVEKEWGGVLTELTSAEDVFTVRVRDRVRPPLRTLALMLPVALDQARFERDPLR